MVFFPEAESQSLTLRSASRIVRSVMNEEIVRVGGSDEEEPNIFGFPRRLTVELPHSN